MARAGGLPAVARQDSLRGAHLLAGLQALVAEGEEDLYFVEGDSLRRPDREGLIDGVHSNDLGMELIAERVMSVLVRAIKE
jgi:lysophospholipase L1-like esterase